MIKIQREPFNTGQEIEALCQRAKGAGAVVSFTGLVRDVSDGRTIRSLTLEHYPGMTQRLCAQLAGQAHERWPLRASLIIHRYGRLVPSDPIVLVATVADHRGDALNACHFLIDWLKTKAPFWKQEDTTEGTHWVEAREDDDQTAQSWL